MSSFFLLLVPIAQAQNSRSILINQSVDESKLVTLGGNTPPEVKKQNDRGPVADSFPMEHMLLQLKRSPAQERELLQLIDELQDSSSPNFHHWLTAKEFGKRFGVSQQDLDTITRWLQSYGLKVNVVYESGLIIDLSGTAGQVRAAFHTEIHELDVNGEKHIANMSDPKIPAALTPAVVGVVSLNDFMPHPMYKPRANYTFSSGGYTWWAMAPADLATIYNMNPMFNAGISGQGQTVAVLEDSDIYTAVDWNTFRKVFGLSSSFPTGSLTQVQPPPPSGANNCTDPGAASNDVEATLDVEWASAAAPSAAIELASCADTSTTFGGLIALLNLVNGSAPPAVISLSYGLCEARAGQSTNIAFSTAYQEAVTEGISVFVSSGDEGASSCSAGLYYATYGIGVSGMASTPYNVAVGGTDFGDGYAGTTSTYWSSTNSPTYESALSYIPEIPWNSSCASALIATTVGGASTTPVEFCNSTTGMNSFITVAAGSGGPSGCATGTPSINGEVGGTCAGYAKPSWQLLTGVPSDGVRDIPDVSLFAASGVWGHYYPFCFSDPNYQVNCNSTPDNWAGAGGTSFSSPIMAGIQALVNQRANGLPQGNPNPIYYQLAATEYGASGDSSCNSTSGNAAGSSCIFYDVTLGDNDIPSVGDLNCYQPSGDTFGVLSTSNSAYQPAYGTTTGWDFATGIGTVNVTNLANNWPGVPSLTTATLTSSQNPAVEGVAVTFTVAVTTAGTNQPTGPVTFYDGGTALGSGTLNGAQATYTTSTLALGSHSITAIYGGDTNNFTSTSSVLTQSIILPISTTTLTATANTIPSGGSVTFTATITETSGVSPTGTVTFYSNTSPLGAPVTLSSGVATLTTTALVSMGSASISAVYSGDTNNGSSTSSTLTETVSAATFAIGAVPATQTIPSGGAAIFPITVTPQGFYTSAITFTATVTPTLNAQVTFSPPTVTPNGSPTATTLTISGITAAAISGSVRAANDAAPLPRRSGMRLSVLNASVLWTPFGLAGIFLLGRRKKYAWKVVSQFLMVATLIVIALTMLGCGSSSSSGSQKGQTYQVQITATAAASGNSGPVTTTTTVAFTAQ
jgi:subtilase family serine protease